MAEVPLFPLEVVVFPGMTVPIHVFEERYKRLVSVSLEQEHKRFAVVLVTDNAPIRDTPVGIATMGTLVDVLSVQENGDGSFDLLVHGQERCSVDVVRREDVREDDGGHRPLFFVDDEPVPVERGDPNQEQVAAWDALDTFREYARAFFADGALAQVEANLPADPLYQASFICANMRVPLASRQVLLEARTLTERFELARKIMAEQLSTASDKHA
ncbi:MAG: LON peptidase substrate-binding domain-containing protein [Deinococcales bacterium]